MRENDLRAQAHDLSVDAATRVVAAAGIRRGDRVWEVGAGTGALTAVLASTGAEVRAVERDAARAETLRRRLPAVPVTVGDALRTGPGWDGPWRVVANPPFNLTALLVERWSLDPAVTALDLVLQREAAEKLTGGPGRHTRSSALLSAIGRAHVVARLDRAEVTPPSRVDLAQWAWRRAPDAPDAKDLRRLGRLLETAFAGPRTMTEALRGLATGVQIRRQAAEHGWKPDDHPRAIPAVAWLPLMRLLAMCGKL